MRSFLILAGSVGLVLGADTEAGKAVYEKSCQVCHSPNGQGNPAIAKALNVTMPALSSPEVQSQSDTEISKTMSQGKGKMKAVSLKKEQLSDLIAYLRSLPRNKR